MIPNPEIWRLGESAPEGVEEHEAKHRRRARIFGRDKSRLARVLDDAGPVYVQTWPMGDGLEVAVDDRLRIVLLVDDNPKPLVNVPLLCDVLLSALMFRVDVHQELELLSLSPAISEFIGREIS